MANLDGLITTREAADLLTEGGYPVSDETVRNWVRSGRLDAVKNRYGRRWLLRRSDIEPLLQELSNFAQTDGAA